jgi:mannose/fructose/N-acetylgalactosamine-specific phosphotransferase system component IID
MTFFALVRTFFRSFFLQTLWNFERMQNIGFAFSIEPLLRRAAKTPEQFRSALRRHLQFFNTHPYFAPIIMGTIYFKELERPASFQGEDATLTMLKDSMGGAFGAIGDHVIWGTWRPFCAVVGLGVGWLVASSTPRGLPPLPLQDSQAPHVCAQWWVAGFLGMFNAVHLWLRWRGLQKAAATGPGVVSWVQSLHLQAWAAQLRRIGLLILAALIFVYLERWSTSPILFWMVVILLGTVILKRWALSGVGIFYLVCAAAAAMAFLGIQWPTP